MKTPHVLPVVAVAMLSVGVLSSRLAAATVPILSTDFSTLTPSASFADNAVIGGPSATSSLVAKRTAGQTYVNVAAAGGALQLARNGNFTLGLFKAIDDGASFEKINGSMTFSLLNNGLGTRPDLAFGLNSNDTFAGTGGTNTSMHFAINSTGNLLYINGTMGGVTAATLSVNVSYRIEFSVDYTSATQDTWSFTLYDVANNSVVTSASAINTRAANIVPGSFVAVGSGGSNSLNPFFEVSQITLEGVTAAVPEPSSSALLAGGLLLAFGVLSRRRRH